MENILISDFEEPIQSNAMQAVLDELQDVDIPLDRQSLLNLAKEKIDVEIDLDDTFFERFEGLFDEVFENAPVHQAGKQLLQQITVNGIVQNSRMSWLIKNHPEITSTPLTPPLIIAGMPRSGTTYLLQLLASEPEFAALPRWEAAQPIPSRAVIEGAAADSRREEGSALLNMMDELLPLLKHMYGAVPDDATEEIELKTNGCYGVSMSFYGDTPKFDKALYETDQSEGYRYLYQFIQTLSWIKKNPANKQWLLKSPQHMGMLPSLDAVFPNSTLVFTHRDPASVFISLLTMMGYFARRIYSKMTKEQILGMARRMQHGFLRGVVKDAERFEGRCEHIYFHELMNDYRSCVERVYSINNMTFDDAAKARVDEQAKNYSRGRHGARIVYDLEATFGITRDSLREEFSYYLDKFPVELEDSQQ